jgi:hypothetical protein
MLEALHFTICTDSNSITYAFQQKRDKHSLRQFNHLDFLAQFTFDIQHLTRTNVAADALSHIQSITAPSLNAVAASQDSDDELRTRLV